MASTFTVTKESVCSDMRVRIGTLTMTDGDAAAAIPSGLNYIYGVFFTSSSMTKATINAGTNGYFSVTTATSGATYNCMILGY